jgi:hypothetical protein
MPDASKEKVVGDVWLGELIFYDPEVLAFVKDKLNHNEVRTMQYETKDSGQRQDYASGMRRDVQTDKPDLTSWMNEVPYKESFLYRVGCLAARGAEKYGRSNFQLANSQEELDRFKASAFRHMMQWQYNETDEDHAAAVVFNLWAAEMVKYKLRNGGSQ